MPIKVLALVPGLDHVCCRYRMAALQAELALSDIRLSLAPLPAQLWSRLNLYRTTASYDAVILQRELLNWLELRQLRRAARRLILDYDDAIWLRDSYTARGFHSRKRERRFARIVRTCDDVFAGNDYLAEEARRRNAQLRVHTIPTVVNPARYPIARHHSTEAVRLVWIGSASTLQGLDQFRGVLEQLGQAMPNLVLRLICDRFLSFQHLRTEAIPWAEATEAQHLSECDIGISWIPDDAWSRGKCGLKILQYQAAGLPVVANPVGVHPRMLHQVGRLAETAADWIQAIRELAADAAQRRQLGQLARQQVEQHYSIMKAAQLWQEALRHPNHKPLS